MKKDKKQRICKNRFLAFLLSALMLICAFLGGICVSIGSGALGEANIEDMISSSGVSSAISNAVTDMLADKISSSMGIGNSDNSEGNDEADNSDKGVNSDSSKSSAQSRKRAGAGVSVQSQNRAGIGISVQSQVNEVAQSDASTKSDDATNILEKVLKSDQGKELMQGVTDQLIGAVFNEDKSFSTEDVEKQLMDIVDQEIDSVLSDYAAEMDANPGMSASDSKVINDLAKSFGVELNDDIYAALDEYDGDVEKFKKSAMQSIEDNFLNDFSDEMREQLAKVEEEINIQINDVYKSETIDLSIFDKVVEIISYIKITGIVLLVLTGIMWLLQLLLYKRGIYGAFRNGAIVLFIAAVPLLALGLTTKVVDMILEMEMIQSVLAPIAESGISVDTIIRDLLLSVLDPFKTVGIVYAVITVVFIILAIVLKIVHKNNVNAEAVEEDITVSEPIMATSAAVSQASATVHEAVKVTNDVTMGPEIIMVTNTPKVQQEEPTGDATPEGATEETENKMN